MAFIVTDRTEHANKIANQLAVAEKLKAKYQLWIIDAGDK